ncbi:MAG: hypothetical protein SRB1_02069 [Desulfobacteraceae bacterium Eth-SRB1]|nr:MAG: hypothetical protein SRB1_02069 [Desulfobacteraceae bacterium Eth-SRB1]
MKRIIFLDTGYLIALIRKKDQFHAAAMEASELYPGPFLTTFVIGEADIFSKIVINLSSARKSLIFWN